MNTSTHNNTSAVQAALEALQTAVTTLNQHGGTAARPLLQHAIEQLQDLPVWSDNAALRSHVLGLYAQAIVGDGDVLEGIRTVWAALQAQRESGQPNAQAQDLLDTLVYHLCGCYANEGEGMDSTQNHLPPDWASTWPAERIANLVLPAVQHNDPLAAEAALRWALCREPQHAQWWDTLTNTLLHFKHTLAAIDCAQALTKLRPDAAPSWKLLAMCLSQAGYDTQALEAMQRACALDRSLDNLCHLAAAQRSLGDLRTSEATAREALELDPNSTSARAELGITLSRLGRLHEAIEQWRHVLDSGQADARAYYHLIVAHERLGEHAQMQALLRQAIALYPDNANLLSANVMLLSYAPEIDQQTWFDAHLAYGHAMRQSAPEQPMRLRWDGQRRLRVGFVSSDLAQHPVGIFLRGMMPHLAAHVDIVIYSVREHTGDIHQALRASVQEWNDCQNMDEHTLLRKIRSDNIDVLLDMNGHTDGGRLSVFAQRAAPIQASWIGYFATTGLDAMDWILCDDVTMPASQERYFTERAARINPCYLSWVPPAEASATPVSALPMLSPNASGPVFGCFSNLSKINANMLQLWRRLLQAVPNAQLLIKNGQLAAEQTRENLRDTLRQAGLNLSRISLEGPSNYAEYFAAYQRVDVMLDTFPYPGGTTTADALFMGVPVVNLRGRGLVGGIGTSIINTVGLSQWLARDEEDYLRIAIEAVQHPAQLAALRQGLRTQLLQSEFADVVGFADKLAQVFEAMARIKLQEQDAQNQP